MSENEKDNQVKIFLLSMKKLRKMHFGDVMQAYGIKPSEFMILHCMQDLKKTGVDDIKLSELTKLVKNAPSTLSPMIQSLVVKGFLQRRSDEKDRRVSYISFTESGLKATETINKKVEKRISSYFLQFGEENTKQLLKLLTELGGLVEKQTEKEQEGENNDKNI